MRKKIIGANWKMNKDLDLAIEYSICFNTLLELSPIKAINEKIEVIIFPPFPFLIKLTEQFKNKKIKIGAQNCAAEEYGAFTGEVSAQMIKSTGAEWLILGHSERRTIYGENMQIIAKKLNIAIKNDLKVILCCGETLEERKNNKHFDVIFNQINSAISNINNINENNLVIAYEPVWAIGTGISANTSEISQMHKFIRKKIAEIKSINLANNISIIYGGSCNPENAKEIFSLPDVDGGLIGSASLQVESFHRLSQQLASFLNPE